jgi:Flp pilus assembly CpaE family ATPase
MNSAPTVTLCAGAKGGQGTTTVAALLALLSARHGRPTLLIDTQGDAASVLGLPEQPPSSSLSAAVATTIDVAERLRVAHLNASCIDETTLDRISELAATGHDVFIDTGTDYDTLHRFDSLRPRRLLVTRACYLAIRRAIAVPFTPDHVVLIREYHRALTEADVSRALALPVTRIVHDPSIARTIDAGLLAVRVPRCLVHPLQRLLDD